MSKRVVLSSVLSMKFVYGSTNKRMFWFLWLSNHSSYCFQWADVVRVAVEESQLLIPLVTINTDKIILPKHSESVILNWTLLNFSLAYFHFESPARCSPASFSLCKVGRAAAEIVSLRSRWSLFLLLYNTIRDAVLARTWSFLQIILQEPEERLCWRIIQFLSKFIYLRR